MVALSVLHQEEALAESKPDEIVAMDLLTVKEPKSEAESRLRIIRLTTRGGSTGYGDYLDFGLPSKDEEETLARLVNRYAAQGHKQNIFLTDPSMRAVGSGHTVIGQTANEVLHAKTREWPGRAMYHREGFGPMWQGPGKSGLVIALQAALLDLTTEKGPGQVRLCPSISIDREVDGKRRLSTPDEMQQTVASLKDAGFTAVRLELAGALDDEMKARGECAPYRYPQEVLGQIGSVLAPETGRIGGVTMLARTADLAKDAKLKVAPVVQGGPFSLMAVARSLTGRDEVLWVTSCYQDEWLKEGGVLKSPLKLAQGSLVAESCEIDETKFQVKRVAELTTKSRAK